MPLKITVRPFQTLSKICGDINKSRCTTGFSDGINVPAPNYAIGTGGVVDTGNKFVTGRKFVTGGNYTRIAAPLDT
jgi:hypothetical protein